MHIIGLDHLVLTTAHIKDCLYFYTTLLGMQAEEQGERYVLRFASQKINLHCRPAEFLPAATAPTPGSLDICLEIAGDLEIVYQELVRKGAPLETEIVARNGARGPMRSIYLRDPDGNLVELCSYSAQA